MAIKFNDTLHYADRHGANSQRLYSSNCNSNWLCSGSVTTTNGNNCNVNNIVVVHRSRGNFESNWTALCASPMDTVYNANHAEIQQSNTIVGSLLTAISPWPKSASTAARVSFANCVFFSQSIICLSASTRLFNRRSFSSFRASSLSCISIDSRSASCKKHRYTSAKLTRNWALSHYTSLTSCLISNSITNFS